MAKQSSGENRTQERATVALPIPAADPALFRHKATDDVLHVLIDAPYDSFTIRELARLTDNTAPAAKRAVDTLAANGVIVTEATGNRRLVSIDRDRVSKPDDPVLRIPQAEYHRPVWAALERLCDELDGVIGVLLYGSVARGEADRRSDIDLWVLAKHRASQQHLANEIARELGHERFDGDRYEFQVLVESPETARSHREDLRGVFADAITLIDGDALRSLKQAVASDAG